MWNLAWNVRRNSRQGFTQRRGCPCLRCALGLEAGCGRIGLRRAMRGLATPRSQRETGAPTKWVGGEPVASIEDWDRTFSRNKRETPRGEPVASCSLCAIWLGTREELSAWFHAMVQRRGENGGPSVHSEARGLKSPRNQRETGAPTKWVGGKPVASIEDWDRPFSRNKRETGAPT
jgi:hypothetical protein